MTHLPGRRRSLAWWAIVYAALITPMDVERLGLLNAGGPDLIKWVLRFPVWFLPLALLLPRWGTLLLALRRPPVSWLMAWGFLGSVSFLWAVEPFQAVLLGLSMLSLIVLATWFVFDSDWHDFATAVVVGLTIFHIVGLFFDFQEGSLLTGRAFGLTSGPTTQGRISAFTIVLAGGIIWSRRSSRWFWLAPVVASVTLILSQTRTAAAAATLGLLIGALPHLRRSDRLATLAITGGIGVGVLAMSTAINDAAQFEERGGLTTVAGRTDVWPVAIQLIRDQPLLGYGWGSSNSLFIAAARDGDISFLAGTTHSVVLATLVQGGIVGFLLFSIAVVSIVRHRRRVDPWVVAPLAVVLVGGLTEAVVHLPSVAIMLLAGMTAAIARRPRWSSETMPAAPGKWPKPVARRVDVSSPGH